MTIPYGENGPFHALQQIKQLTLGCTPKLISPPQFMDISEKVYGPVFIGVHGTPRNIEEIEHLRAVSKNLPNWFYTYNPGINGSFPKTVIHSGKHHLLIHNN
ncbi:hypothetical protein D3C80_1042190 [compost metagenome]